MLETKLNSGNVFKAINTWAVSVVRYSAAFLGWSRLQQEEIDRRTRKKTMHNGFHPKSNVDRLYLSRSEGGRGLIGVQNTVETAILGLRNYVRNNKDRLLIEDEDKETPHERKNSGHKNSYMDNLLGKQWVKQVKIGGDG